MTWWWLAYPLLGIFSGFIAGLFGVGGGLILVPFLFMLFTMQGFTDTQTMHMALGTAMGSIMFTSISSMTAHHQHSAVRWDIFRSMAPGLVFGTLGGSAVASGLATQSLAMLFTAIVYIAALQMMLGIKPKATRSLPGRFGLLLVGTLIGFVSSLVSAGGGFMSVPFMLWSNVVVHQAVGTSAALGFPIAVGGFIGYVASGWNAPGLPPYSFGYVYLPALIGVVLMSFSTAPLGAKLAHRLPVGYLKRAFGIFLVLLATKMLAGLLG
ncbi:MAG TPA: sulfite exporter TauE/SafE family protein [Rhodocyclaceae bacterium]|nr:sulfite exporter TauE/SafE family protein [Rhodocyclaceae bacterium]